MQRMNKNGRKQPKLLITKTKRVPLSTRVKTNTKQTLMVAAKEAKTSVSDLTAAIVDDYCEWLISLKLKHTK